MKPSILCEVEALMYCIFIQAEEKVLKEIGAETSRLSGALFRAQQVLLNWENDYKLLEVK